MGGGHARANSRKANLRYIGLQGINTLPSFSCWYSAEQDHSGYITALAWLPDVLWFLDGSWPQTRFLHYTRFTGDHFMQLCTGWPNKK